MFVNHFRRSTPRDSLTDHYARRRRSPLALVAPVLVVALLAGSPTSLVLKLDNTTTISSQSVTGSTATANWNTAGVACRQPHPEPDRHRRGRADRHRSDQRHRLDPRWPGGGAGQTPRHPR